MRYPTIWNADSCWVPHSGHHPEYIQLLLELCRFVLGCGVSNRNDVGKYGALMAVDMLTLQYLSSVWKEYL